MPSSTSTTLTPDGTQRVHHRHSYSEDGMFDHDEYWVTCAHCEVILADDSGAPEDPAFVEFHKEGRCVEQ